MKKILPLSIFALIATFLVSSCSVEKRLYRDGFHVAWNKSERNNKKIIIEDEVTGEDVVKSEPQPVEESLDSFGEKTEVTENDNVVSEDNLNPAHTASEKKNQAVKSALRSGKASVKKVLDRNHNMQFSQLTKDYKASMAMENQGQGFAMLLLGILLMILGWLIFRSIIFASLSITVLLGNSLMFLGLILLIVGLVKIIRGN